MTVAMIFSCIGRRAQTPGLLGFAALTAAAVQPLGTRQNLVPGYQSKDVP